MAHFDIFFFYFKYSYSNKQLIVLGGDFTRQQIALIVIATKVFK